MEIPHDWTSFMECYKERVIDAFKSDGMAGVSSFIMHNLEEWKDIPLNIAVTGNSGSGKSSFINTIRGLYADDEGAAKAGVTQCTLEPTSYRHPNNENLRIWDLPGVGTPRFPRESYLEKVEFQRYDCFIIISASRFTENDLWLAKEVRKQNHSFKQGEQKEFYFVRAKVDSDIANSNIGRRKPEPQDEILSRILQELEDTFQKNEFVKTRIFLMANYKPNLFDFDSLQTRIVNESGAKREAMALSLSGLTEGVIEQKREAFTKRMWKVCMQSAVGGAIPIPVVSILIDEGLLITEVKEYRKQLGLNEEGLKRSARLLNIPVEDMSHAFGLESPAVVLTIRGIAMVCSVAVFSEYIENAVKYTVPVFGSFISGGISYYATRVLLEKMLDMMVRDAKKINERIKIILESSV